MNGPKIDAAYRKSMQQAREELRQLIEAEHAVPLLLRLAIHDAFAYDATKKVYGANASIRTQKELAHAGNEGLARAVELLAPLKAKHNDLTHADLFQLAGVVAVEAAGGPAIPFTPGRRDAWTFPPQDAYLSPNTGGSPLEQFLAWVHRTGLPLRGAVALLGAHALARWWPEAGGGYSLPHERLPQPRFSNAYFRQLLDGRVPQDGWLLDDAAIKDIAQTFADSEAQFRQEYADAHEQLSRLGTRLAAAGAGAVPQPSAAAADWPATAKYAAAAAGVAAASGLVAYGLWRRRARRLARAVQ